MNVMRKNSAAKKYAPLLAEGKTEQEIMEALKADDKKYSDDEIIEILNVINGAGSGDEGGDEGGDEEESKTKEAPANAPAKAAVRSVSEALHTVYDEWKMDYDGGKPYPSRKLRSGVKLHDEQRATLNEQASKWNPTMYLTADEASKMRGE